jgi:CRISPR-associated protein Cas2
MVVLVTYDVSTSSPAGVKRLRKIAKTCLNYGQRVQNSVFELLVDPGQWTQCKAELCELVDPSVDSLRFYYLGANWQRRVEHFGAKPSLDLEGPLII